MNKIKVLLKGNDKISLFLNKSLYPQAIVRKVISKEKWIEAAGSRGKHFFLRCARKDEERLFALVNDLLRLIRQ